MAGSNDNQKLVWFCAGAAIGATIALLVAPTSGEKIRRAIGRRTAEGRESLAEVGREWLEKGRELYDKGRQIADEAAEMFDRGRKLVSS